MSTYSLYRPPVVDDGLLVTADPLDICAVVNKIHHPKAGAVVLFSGEVRNHNHGRDVSHLEYEAYTSMADKMIREILDRAKQKWQLHEAYCIHRIGLVNIGESAVIVATASSHRQEAYEANQFIIDRVKHEAPIWKKEVFVDGSHEWGNNCSCH